MQRNVISYGAVLMMLMMLIFIISVGQANTPHSKATVGWKWLPATGNVARYVAEESINNGAYSVVNANISPALSTTDTGYVVWFGHKPADSSAGKNIKLRVCAGDASNTGPVSIPSDAVIWYPADINKDGVVNALDLALFSNAWGSTEGQSAYNYNADFIGADGQVNGLDFAFFSKWWGSNYKSGAPPAVIAEKIPFALYDSLPAELKELIDKLPDNHGLKMAITKTPLYSDLYQNFPNPFNPETWIPYEISTDSRVIIYIYDSSGQLIRSLDLGIQKAGAYRNKEKAAHWDGINFYEEKVASGVYFYTIMVNGFTKTKKMVVWK